MALENYGTIWVCGDCLHHHANGECGSCHEDNHDAEPLSAIGDGFTVAMGMGEEDHDSDCLKYILSDLRATYPDMDWPDIPGDYECDCETITFSHGPCDGCATYLYGERHAMTLFKE